MATSARFFTSNGYGEKDWRLAAFAAAFARKKSLLIFHRKICWKTFCVRRKLKPVKYDRPQNLGLLKC
jgi:hypothetical protein